MDLKKIGLSLAIALPLILKGACPQASELTDKYVHALEQNDFISMTKIIEDNKDKLPGEVKSLLEEAKQPGISPEDRDAKFYQAELMAKAYKDATNEVGPLKEVKMKAFDAKLAPATRPAADNGVYMIELPKPTGDVKNVFKPENIVIKKGETVKWVNKDDTPHIFATMPVISAASFNSKSVEPNGTFEYKFEKPGEYFYLCFIHHAMIGKITVEE
ncbi:MAG: cupredoxin domain-containing protein [Deltaproteobacteria bacterium]|nr:cupredoxin domain-containing protein [Deltaproteobacteria bacterium]